MAIIVIGGQSRNVGKTSVVCGLIAAMPERRWTAIKITQCKHDGVNGEPCDCELAGGNMAISEAYNAMAGTDSSRYLAAGAARSFWVRVQAGCFAEAMPCIRAEIGSAVNVILESNSVLAHLKPDFYATVLDPAIADFKPSARKHLRQADAILISTGQTQQPTWKGISADLMQGVRTFQIGPPSYCSAEFVSLVTSKLDGTQEDGV